MTCLVESFQELSKLILFSGQKEWLVHSPSTLIVGERGGGAG